MSDCSDEYQNGEPGEALQRALALRGCRLSLEESRRLAELLMDLAVAGVLVPVEPANGNARSE